jgi:hypothetical protein
MPNTVNFAHMMKQFKRIGARAVIATAFAVMTVGAGLAIAPQPAFAQDSGFTQQATDASESSSVKEQVIFWLSAYHGQPTHEQLDQAGAAGEVAALLREIAADKDARPSMRLRAVDSLGHYADDASVGFLERTIATPSSLEVQRPQHTELLRHHAMLSFARACGEAAVQTLVPFTEGGAEAGDLQLRLTAISALGRFGGEAGRVELERLQTRVDHPVLKRSLKKFVGSSSE